MEVAEKLDNLEDEFKILKSELKTTLTNVREFLLMVRPLPGQSGSIIQADEDDFFGADTASLTPNDDIFGAEEPDELGTDSIDNESEIPEPEMVDEIPEPEILSPDAIIDVPEPEMASETLGNLTDSEQIVSDDKSQIEECIDDTSSLNEGGDMAEKQIGLPQNESQVNVLSNLVHWISFARKDIGSDKIADFLDIYGVSRRLPSGLKEFILHLAETLDNSPIEANPADNWTRLTLELHGILAGGTPFHSVKAYKNGHYDESQHSNNGYDNLQSIIDSLEVKTR